MQKGWVKVEALQKIQLPAGELKLPCGIRLLNAAVPLYTGAGTEYFMMGTIADDHELRDSVIMINRIEEHCALAFEDGLYDITGRISVKNFHRASMREISFMKKNYIPHFNTEELEEYLAGITE